MLLLIVVGVPLVVLLLVASIVAGSWYLLKAAVQKFLLLVRRLFGYHPRLPDVPMQPEPKEIFCAPQLRLLTTEEDWETEGKNFTEWLDPWGELDHEFGNHPGLFRLHTEPEILGLHGQLISDLCRVVPEGVFLQMLEPKPGQQQAGTSWLLYLDLVTLQWQRVAETGDFYLLPEAANGPDQFNGIQAGGSRLELRVQPVA